MLSARNCTCYHTSSPTLSAHPEILESRASARTRKWTHRRNSRNPPRPSSFRFHAKTLKVTAPPSQVITQQTKGWRHPLGPRLGTVITLPKQGHRSRSSRGPGGTQTVARRSWPGSQGSLFRGTWLHASHKVVGFTSMSPTSSNGQNQRQVPPGGFGRGGERALKNTRALCSS